MFKNKFLIALFIFIVIYLMNQERFISFFDGISNLAKSAKDNKAELEKFEGSNIEKMASVIALNVLQTEIGKNMLKASLVQSGVIDKEELVISSTTLNASHGIVIVTNGSEHEPPSYCGCTANVSYRITNKNGDLLEQKDNYDLALDDQSYGISSIVIGMKPGEMRNGQFVDLNTFKEMHDKTDHSLSFDSVRYIAVKLNSVKSQPVKDIRMFAEKVLKTRYITCGEPVASSVRVIDFANNILYAGKINYILGSKDYPIVFSYALHASQSKNKISVVAPYKYLKKHDGTDFIKNAAHIDPEHLVLIEFVVD